MQTRMTLRPAIRSTRRILPALALSLFASAASAEYCDWGWQWLANSCDGAVKAYKGGAYDLYLTGYAYHGRGTYSDEALNDQNEQAWGAGIGRTHIDERNNSHGIYFMGFKDSHYKPEWLLGYSWLARWGLAEHLNVGVGVTAGFTTRTDYCDYLCPVPYILPLGAIEYRKVSLMATWVPKLPGAEGNGDVLFLFGKISFD